MKIGYCHYGTFMSQWVVWVGESGEFKDAIRYNPDDCTVDHKAGTIEINNDGVISHWEFEPNSSIGDTVYKAFVREEKEYIVGREYTKVWITSEMSITIPTEFLKRTKFRSQEWFIKEYKRYIGSKYPSDIKTITSSVIDMMIRHHLYRHRGLEDYQTIPAVYKTVDILKEALGSINFTMEDVFV
ncbi:hypothetical protein F485_gp402 [Aeromonas phage CC2]|uniref:Uncharacterized protein n=1 Tax=Aeromonas phage CC2 TaxID=1204516 RepID=I6WBZ9_9CAUD|nr:hypothetical protein F485_gp402 [Aeromonas phage CC2]AFN39485.1 hypothetical protein CC2_402 [Aeromonas phage CC2]